MSENNHKLWSTRLAVGKMAYDMAYFGQAVRHFTKALDLAKANHFGEEELSSSYLALGKALACMGRYQEAEGNLSKALEIDERSPERSIERATDYVELALFYSRTGRIDEAADYNARAISLLDHLDNTPASLLAKALKQLAVIKAEQHDFDLASLYIDRAIEALEKEGGQKQSLIYGESLMVKTIVLLELGDTEGAQALYPQAIQTIELNRGPFNPKLANMMDMFSELTAETGHPKASEILHKKAEVIRNAKTRKTY